LGIVYFSTAVNNAGSSKPKRKKAKRALPKVAIPEPSAEAVELVQVSEKLPVVANSTAEVQAIPEATATAAIVQVEGEVKAAETVSISNETATVAFKPMTKEELEAAAPTLPVEQKAKRTKVAILGFTDSWKLAPFQDPEYEIWGLNELYQFIPRWDRWFELHSRRVYENDRNRVSDHIQKLKAMTCPVYMHQKWDDIPASVPYPLQEVAQCIPNPSPGAKPYLTNTISYMIALAIIEGFTDIGVFGVDMAHSTEYGQQRPSCEFYVGIAMGRGIRVYIPPEADLLKTPFLYGYEEEAANAFDVKLKARKAEIEQKIAGLDNQITQLVEARAQYRGAHQDTDYMLSNWKSQH